jgi:diguanylate cyclase (GGDEF)-like protein
MQNDELQGVNEVLEQLSITDGLTKLHNHRYFQEALIHECKRAGRTETPLSLILIDLDYFKRWNDRFGHAAGDQILSGIAHVMTDLVRETDRLARYGGEEFALLTPGTVLEGAAMLAEKIRAAVAASSFDLDLQGGHEPVTVSIGVAAYRDDPKALFNDADRALYRAKEAGRDCVIVAEPS